MTVLVNHPEEQAKANLIKCSCWGWFILGFTSFPTNCSNYANTKNKNVKVVVAFLGFVDISSIETDLDQSTSPATQ